MEANLSFNKFMEADKGGAAGPGKHPPYEGLGTFYLGRESIREIGDSSAKAGGGGYYLYDSNDLLTHALCVGMTGSGKTGLGVCLLEEAAIDGIPAIVIDPKGDMGNLLLCFDDPKPQDYIDNMPANEARKHSEDLQGYAESLCEGHLKRLADFDQLPERAARLKEKCGINLYTPGYMGGRPLSIKGMFGSYLRNAASPDVAADLISGNTGALLSLVGIESDPLSSPEHIFISNILQYRAKQGIFPDPVSLIADVYDPPFDKLGALPLEMYYPAKEREKLARRLNALPASPDFAAWLAGEELNVDRLLYDAKGKPKISVIYTAHLSEEKRMFFTSLLLNTILAWMRGKQGTSSLRALLYMDEIAGYVPPVSNPPSKEPLMKMLKQARAFGLGIVLSTQNPGDVDYKGLSNIGTWFIGRLRTDRDRAKLLEGMETGAAVPGSPAFSRENLDRTIASLNKREFVVSNAHESEPLLFGTREALSYLRGPITIREAAEMAKNSGDAADVILEGQKAFDPNQGQSIAAATPVAAAASIAAATLSSQSPATPAPEEAKAAKAPAKASPKAPPKAEEAEAPAEPESAEAKPPVTLPANVKVYYDRANVTSRGYKPMLLGKVRIYYEDKRKDIGETEERSFITSFAEAAPGGADWEFAEESELEINDLYEEAEPGIAIDEPPKVAYERGAAKKWETGLKDYAYRNCRLSILLNPGFKIYSQPGESERDFVIRVADETREKRDAELEKLRERYTRKIETAANALGRAEDKLERKERQSADAKRQSAFSIGNAVFSALLGRKKFSSGSIGKAATAGKAISRTGMKSSEVKMAEDDYASAKAKYEAVQEEFEEKLEELRRDFEEKAERTETYEVRPLKGNISVTFIAIYMKAY